MIYSHTATLPQGVNHLKQWGVIANHKGTQYVIQGIRNGVLYLMELPPDSRINEDRVTHILPFEPCPVGK